MIQRYFLDGDWNGKVHESYASDGEWCKFSDVDKIISENSELRTKLAVYEDGRPCKEYLEWFLDEQGVWMLGEQEYRQSIEWLKRIASANEVPNDKP